VFLLRLIGEAAFQLSVFSAHFCRIREAETTMERHSLHAGYPVMKCIQRFRRPRPWPNIARIAGVVVTAALAGCAPQPFADDGLTKRSAALLGTAAIPSEPKPFVRDQREAAPAYIAVGVTPPKRELQPRSAAEAAALEAELTGQRDRARGFATRPAPPPSYDGSLPPRPAPPPKELLPQ
jgi:hypothetical protein